MQFAGVPPYGIPEIYPEHIDIRHLEWIPFNYAKTAKNRESKGIHFYLDDYQFARLWNRPDDYINLLSQFGAVSTPVQLFRRKNIWIGREPAQWRAGIKHNRTAI